MPGTTSGCPAGSQTSALGQYPQLGGGLQPLPLQLDLFTQIVHSFVRQEVAISLQASLAISHNEVIRLEGDVPPLETGVIVLHVV